MNTPVALALVPVLLAWATWFFLNLNTTSNPPYLMFAIGVGLVGCAFWSILNVFLAIWQDHKQLAKPKGGDEE